MAELSVGGLSPEAIRALDLATVIAGNSGHHAVLPDHLAIALLKQSDNLASKLVRNYVGADLFELRTRLEAVLRTVRDTLTGSEQTHRYQGQPYPVSPALARLVERARRLAAQQRKPAAGTDHLLAALLDEESPGVRTLETAGVRAYRIHADSSGIPLPPTLAGRHGAPPTQLGKLESAATAGWPAGPGQARRSDQDGAFEAQANGSAPARRGVAVDLVQAFRDGTMPALVERKGLLDQLAGTLVQPRTSAVLLGEAGVGRRSLAWSLAQVVARSPLPGIRPALYTVSQAALLDGPELVVRQAIEVAQGAVLILPDLHQFFGAASLTGFAEAGVALRQALLEGTLRLVGTSSPPMHARYLETDAALRDHLRPITVLPTTDAETRAILTVLKPLVERDSGVTVTAEAVEAAAALSRQYVSAPQPAAAVSLLQRATALVRLSQSAVPGGATDVPPGQGAMDSTVDRADVAQALHQQTGIPMGQIAGQEQERLAQMETILHQRVVGQDAAVGALARAVRRARAGLKDPKRPIGSFLFLGPSGVGKTESGLALAEFLFGAEDAVVTINMSEYMEKHNVARLIGAPPGYVGYEEGGQLTERVRQRPYAVVLLDEVEKAHPDVYDLFLQVLDQGQLQDSRGRVVSFRNTVVIMTSNLGARALAYPESLPPGVEPKQAVMEAVREHFRPEFLNRLDGIIVFDPLDRPALARILEILIGKVNRQLADQGIQLEVSSPAKTWLLDQHTEPEMGARPLIRVVQTYLKDEISERLINGGLHAGQRVLVTVKRGKLDFRQGDQAQPDAEAPPKRAGRPKDSGQPV